MAVEKVLIVGSGPAGYTAALYTSRAMLQPLLLEGLQPGGQLTTTTDVENYPGFPEAIDGTALTLKMREQAERFGTRVESAIVAGADFSGRPLKLILDDGRVLETQTVIIATGASARYMGLPSEQPLIGRGVSGCATCDGALYRNVPVAVVGGGDTAMEDSMFLTRFAARVHVIHRRDAFRASPIMAGRVQQHPKIEIHWNSVVDEVFDVARGEVTGVRLKDVMSGATRALEIKALFMAIGHDPNTAPFRGQVAIGPGGYIVANNARTSVPGVFAAGDVQDAVYRQAITAAGSGCMAALEAQRYLEGIRH
jgi:thioredoxin reductase (NADPH)